MVFLISFLAIVLLSLNGFCLSRKSAQGDITMKVSQNIAQVNLGEQHVSKGQRLGIFRQECRFSVCTKERVGGGRVTRVFDKKYSEISLDPGTYYDVGYKIETE